MVGPLGRAMVGPLNESVRHDSAGTAALNTANLTWMGHNAPGVGAQAAKVVLAEATTMLQPCFVQRVGGGQP